MPSKKKKYNARFPAGRIKKIMQSDEEVGKVAQAVPVIISRTLELFVESLLTKTLRITNSRNAKTLSPSHMKQCIMSENQFDFLRELVKNIPDISINDEYGNSIDGGSMPVSPCLESPPPPLTPQTPSTSIQQEPFDLSRPSTSCEYNSTKNSTNIMTSLQQQQINVGISISNGQPNVSFMRNGSNISNYDQQLSGINSSTSTITTLESLPSPSLSPSPSSSSSSSQGIEISCKNSVIAKISIPSLSTNNDIYGKNIHDINLGASNLKKSWETISQLRPPIQSTLKTGITQSSLFLNRNTTSLINENSLNFENTSINSEAIEKLSVNSTGKISRLDLSNLQPKETITTRQIIPKLHESPIKINNNNNNNNNNNISNNNKNNITITKIISKEINKPQTLLSTDIKQNNTIVTIPTTTPTVSIHKNICNTPFLNIDYSNLKLLQHDNNSTIITTPTIDNNDHNKLIKTPESSNNSAVINIDLSKIEIQPPTINFNFDNFSTSDNITKNFISSTPTSETTLELDEDYDNI